MNRKYMLVATILALASLTMYARTDDAGVAHVVTARQFGAVPDDSKDDTKALRKAAEYCRTHPGTTLVIEPGVYRLRDSKAEQLESEVMAGKMGRNPEQVIFTPYYPYVSGLDFSGAEDTRVMARGAILMCEGWMEPLSIVRTRNFHLEGLAIDYLRKPMTEGNIVKVTDESIVVQFDNRRRLTPEMPITRMVIWDHEANGVFHRPFYFPEGKFLGDNRVEFPIQLPRHLQGARLCALHSFHFRPAILISQSDSTTLEGVTIHSQPGMGVVGFDSKDIFIHDLSVTPAPGFTFSTNTDATHFASCRGMVAIEESLFRGQGDDATNVHGYYHDIERGDDGWTRLVLHAPTYTHAQQADVPEVGDTLEFSSAATLVPQRTFVVTQVRHHPQSPTVDVRLDAPLPAVTDGYYLFNSSKLPKLRFCKNLVWGNLARGVLVKTRDVRVEGNVFRGCTGSAVHVGAESDWREGAHARDVVIRDNMMIDCGTDGGQFGASGIAVVIQAPETDHTFLHENIVVENNVVTTRYGNRCGIALRNIKGVRIGGNSVRGCQQDVDIHSCEDVVLSH